MICKGLLGIGAAIGYAIMMSLMIGVYKRIFKAKEDAIILGAFWPTFPLVGVVLGLTKLIVVTRARFFSKLTHWAQHVDITSNGALKVTKKPEETKTEFPKAQVVKSKK